MNLSGTDIFFITNIPVELKTADLRQIFSQFIEAGAFACFHYRHRPISSRGSQLSADTLDVKTLLSVLKQHRAKAPKSCTAIVAIDSEHSKRILTTLEDIWCSYEKSEQFPLCKFHPIKFDESSHGSLKKLCELSPPTWMPQGNVGTPTSHFFSLIRQCQLSPALIKKLGLEFPRSKSIRKYGSVPFKYEDYDDFAEIGESSYSDSEVHARREIHTQNGITLSNPVNSDEVAEEWDRFEALHDDPYNVDRSANHSLKYESKIELKWEKGGPGLVHYTDEMFWRERESVRKDEFFDEPASFDWDVNMQHYSDEEGLSYTGPGGPDLDRKQIHQMLTSGIRQPHPYISAYGARIMQKHGWRRGARLGNPKRRGLLEPITSEDGTVSTNRAGIGFTAPRRVKRLLPHRFKNTGAYIRSVFDSPEVVAIRSGGTQFVPEEPTASNRFVINNHGGRFGFEGVKFQFGGVIPESEKQQESAQS